MNIDIYTDGACSGNPGPGGTGYVILHGGTEYARGSSGYRRTTNNRMEILAVIEGLMKLWHDNVSAPGITVFTDSEIVYGTMEKGFKTKANKDLWNRLRETVSLFHGTPVTFKKVDGHNGVAWNELADKLAVAGREDRKKCIDSVYEHEHPGNDAVTGDTSTAVPEPEIHEIRLLNHDKPEERLIEVVLTNGTVTKIKGYQGGFEQYDCTRREALVTADLAWRFVGWLNGKKLI